MLRRLGYVIAYSDDQYNFGFIFKGKLQAALFAFVRRLRRTVVLWRASFSRGERL